MPALQRFHFHIADAAADEERRTFRGIRAEAPGEDAGTSFNSDEAAARFHLSRLMAADERPAVRGITAPDRAARVPDLQLIDEQDLAATKTRLVRFNQTQNNIPVFGGHAVCELDSKRGLVSASGSVGVPEGVAATESVTKDEALKRLAEYVDKPAEELAGSRPAYLTFFRDDDEWHLAWHFERVPAAKPGLVEESHGHGLGRSPREMRPLVDYLVDAHSGEIIYEFSRVPLFAAPLPVPAHMRGVSEDDVDEQFWGCKVNGRFAMADPLRGVETHDLALADIEGAQLKAPFMSHTADLGGACRALVSAHVNATKVFNFFNGILLREGIDNKGMDLINVVNVTYAADEPGPSWRNAVWYEDRMWYGQTPGPQGALVSYSRYLDVIAHELTHGVTEYTSDLVYRDQSGALNESYSDIFGIIIKNWDGGDPTGGDVSGWDWELGSGLGPGGAPLRNLRDPSATGDPAHMREYVRTTRDSGGVHINSNIHNKAAYNVLTATGAEGGSVFTPHDVATVYYLALTRLGRQDGFAETLAALVDVASTYWGGDETRDDRIAAIRKAYADVGIQ
jgi:bacillolysin